MPQPDGDGSPVYAGSDLFLMSFAWNCRADCGGDHPGDAWTLIFGCPSQQEARALTQVWALVSVHKAWWWGRTGHYVPAWNLWLSPRGLEMFVFSLKTCAILVGMLLYNIQPEVEMAKADFLSLSLEDSYLAFRYDLGSGMADIV